MQCVKECSPTYVNLLARKLCYLVGFLWSLINVNLHLRTESKIGLDTTNIYSKLTHFTEQNLKNTLYVQYLIVGTLQIVEHTHISQKLSSLSLSCNFCDYMMPLMSPNAKLARVLIIFSCF